MIGDKIVYSDRSGSVFQISFSTRLAASQKQLEEVKEDNTSSSKDNKQQDKPKFEENENDLILGHCSWVTTMVFIIIIILFIL
jgi:hypothetical protein